MTAHTVGAFVSALGLSVLITLIVRALAPRMGLVDQPDNDRKLHAGAMPTGGGIAIFASTAVVIVIGLASGIPEFDETLSKPLQVMALGVGATGIFLLGLLDDLKRLRAWTKFGVQVLMAVGLYAAGIRIEALGLGGMGLELAVWISLPLTIFWLVGITNSFNLIDGSDGVAGGAALFALITFAVVSVMLGRDYSATLSLILAGATLGFLLFNFPPASIYLGDAGSQLLGFSLAALAIVATQKASTVVAVAVPILSFGVPILDTSLAIVRRVLRGRPIFEPDRGHIHHRLAELGHSPRMIAFGLWGLSAIFGLLSLLLLGGTATQVAVVLLAAGVVVFLVIQRLRLPEITNLSTRLSGLKRRVPAAQVPIVRTTHGVATAGSVSEVLAALTEGFGGGQFSEIELRLTGSLARPMRTDSRVTSEGEESVWSEVLDEGEWSWESRFPIEGEERDARGLLVLRHAARYTGARIDLGPIRRELIPALVWSLEELVARMPRLTEPPPARRDAVARPPIASFDGLGSGT